MTCWMPLLFIGLVIGRAYPTLALQSPRDQGQPSASSSSSAQPSNERVIDGEKIGPRVRPRPGETCIVCNNPVGPDDSVYLVQGQRVPMHAEEEREFFLHARKYLMRLKPLGGALLGADSNQPGMANRAGNDRPEVSRAWIYGGVYLLLGLVCAAVCAQRALHTGYTPGAWFGLGLVFNVVAYVLLLTRPKRDVHAPAGVPLGLGKIAATHAPQHCPKCGALNHPSAGKCLGCGASLSPKVESEVRKVGVNSP
jgi:ribosomal protein L40E